MRELLLWFEMHPGLGQWAGAAGGMSAVLAAFLVASQQRRHERAAQEGERRLRAQGLALLLHAEMVEFALRLQRLKDDQNLFGLAGLQPPDTVWNHLHDLYLLGQPGGALLQMVSAVRVTRSMADRMIPVLSNPEITREDFNEVWAPVESNLEIAITDANEAIAGMLAIISDGALRNAKRRTPWWRRWSRPVAMAKAKGENKKAADADASKADG